LISPFLEFSGGNCQDASILVEVTAVALKLSGGPIGTEKKNQFNDKCINTFL